MKTLGISAKPLKTWLKKIPDHFIWVLFLIGFIFTDPRYYGVAVIYGSIRLIEHGIEEMKARGKGYDTLYRLFGTATAALFFVGIIYTFALDTRYTQEREIEAVCERFDATQFYSNAGIGSSLEKLCSESYVDETDWK